MFNITYPAPPVKSFLDTPHQVRNFIQNIPSIETVHGTSFLQTSKLRARLHDPHSVPEIGVFRPIYRHPSRPALLKRGRSRSGYQHSPCPLPGEQDVFSSAGRFPQYRNAREVLSPYRRGGSRPHPPPSRKREKTCRTLCGSGLVFLAGNHVPWPGPPILSRASEHF